MEFSARLLTCLGFALAAPCALFSAIIAGYDATENDRFANDPSFIAAAYDLSGVSHNNRWLTMISPNVFLSAEHFQPATGSSAVFYAANDPLGASVTRTVTATGEQIAGSDIWIGVLDQPLPLTYAFYPFATEIITNNNSGPPGPGANAESFINSPYFQKNAFILGRSEGSYSTSQNMAVGRNVIDGFNPDATPGTAGTGAAIETGIEEPGDGNFVDHELTFQTGDSGGPTFVDIDGALVLVGINWYLGSSNGTPVLNGMSYVGNYTNEINAFLDVHSVPEPRLAALVAGLAVVGWLAGRRRRINSL
jgi:hypothetical protein